TDTLSANAASRIRPSTSACLSSSFLRIVLSLWFLSPVLMMLFRLTWLPPRHDLHPDRPGQHPAPLKEAGRQARTALVPFGKGFRLMAIPPHTPRQAGAFQNSLSPRSQPQAHSVPRPQRERRVRHYRLARLQFDPTSLQDRRQHQWPLQQREIVADAPSRAAAEGEVGELRPVRAPARQETLRPKGVRLLPERRVPVSDVLAHRDDRLLRDRPPVDFVRADRLPRLAPGRRIEPQRLVEDRPRQRQRRQILRRRSSTLELAP